MSKVRITSLSLENFRGIRRGKIQGFSDVNVLVGPNNSGKSSILYAIYLTAGYLTQKTAKRFPFLPNNSKEIQVAFGKSGFKPGYGLLSKWLIYKYNKNLELRILMSISEGKTASDTYYLRSVKESSSTRLPPISPKTREFLLNTRLILAMGEIQRPEESFYENLLSQNLDESLYQLLQEAFHLPVKYMTFTSERVLMLKLRDRAVRFEDLGDGAKQAVRTLFTAAAAAGGALLLEEPENFQHPRSLQESVHTLLVAARELNIQIFVTTHSRECYLAFHHEAKRQKLEARFFYLRRHEDDHVEAVSVTPEGLDAFEEMGFDLRYYESQE